MKKIYVIGNALVDADSLPLRLLPKLQKDFPDINFIEVDPTENFIPENDAIIIDTVVGIDKITLFNSLDAFAQSPKISPHDYDLGFHLKLLKKLRKIDKALILGIPQGMDEKRAFGEAVSVLKNVLKNIRHSEQAKRSKNPIG